MVARGYARISSALIDDRRQYRETQADYAARLGISLRVLSNLESGQPHNYAPATIAAVEDALLWEYGSFENVTHGGTPTLRADGEADRIRRAWQRLSIESRRNLADLAESLARRDNV